MSNFDEFELNLKWFSGYLSADAELRYFESGKCKATFSIPLKKKKEDEAKWLNCECWGALAEKVGELKKGTEVLVLGNFKEDTYKDKDGKEKTKIVFIVKGVL